MKLIITRHGETEENAAGVLMGHLPGKLSSKGRVQAERLALNLKNEKIDCIFSSDLGRAYDTAKMIAKHHENADFRLSKLLREQNVGRLQGKKKALFSDDDISKNKEPDEVVRRRAKRILARALDEYPRGTVLFVAHRWINFILINTIKQEAGIDRDLEPQDNTGVTIFQLSKNKKPLILVHNSLEHLE